MYNNPYASSLDARILSATPIELVNVLYEAALDAVQAARQRLSCGDIVERGRQVSRAVEILAELGGSLNHEKGGELSTRLAALYDYMQRTLLEANFRQADDGLANVEALLSTLKEAWSAIEVSRSEVSRESRPASYSFPEPSTYPHECAARATNQWCA